MEKISMVIALHNDERHLWKFYHDMSKVLKELPITYEFIFIDNGSRDATLHLLRDLSRQDYNCNYLSLSHNVSKMEAVYLGARLATGEYTGFIDCHYPPYLIPHFYLALSEQRYSCVGGSLVQEGRKRGKHQTYFKMMKSHSLVDILHSDNITAFCDRFYNNHSREILWIPYTELEHDGSPWEQRIQLFPLCSRSCLFIIMTSLVIAEFFLPEILFHQEIDIITAYVISNILLVMFLFLLHTLHKIRHPLSKDNIKETTFTR